jgi:hypothetical protein
MLRSSLYYSNQLDLLSGKQRKQLISYLEDVKKEQDEESIVFGY